MTTANRPGLDALAYRVGAHATFLETMKARLSGFWLDVPREEFGPDGRRLVDRIYPLRGLTTRESDDPAIALLDAWAMVGDVLTFYQERIANEGYLRTATERRSVLELVRLIAYALRPGVSASVYFALTLEKDHAIVLKPNELRTQSVPGPGELPQTFENSEALDARAAWNTLKPRMTRPQTEKSISSGDSPRLFLKGLSANLKPNDPLIIDFAGDRQFVRVKEVKPDAAADRTLVTLQRWPGAEAPRGMASPEAIADGARGELGIIAAHYLGEEADRIGLSRRTVIYRNVRGHLEELQPLLAEDAPFPAMMERLGDETLPNLTAELEGIEDRPQNATRRAWLESLIAELNDVATRASALRAEALAMEFTHAAPIDAGRDLGVGAGVAKGAQGDQFTNVVTELVKPPSVPPASARQLKRSVDGAFQGKADTGIQLAGAFQEKLRESLPVAVASAKVTPDVGIKVYALRAKAALFGHNAARQPVPVRGDDHTPPRFTLSDPPTIKNTWGSLVAPNGELTVAALDAVYDQITPGGLVAIEHPHGTGSRIVAVRTVAQTQQTTMEVVSLAIKVSVLTLENAWLDFAETRKAVEDSVFLRGVTVYAQSEELPLAEEPIDAPICGSNDASDSDALIELDALYSGLQAGRWLVVSGERTDIQVPDPDNPNQKVSVTGVKSSELVMLAEVVQKVPEAEQVGQPGSGYYGYGPPPVLGEKLHTFIRLATKLEYRYKRDTVTIYGNVVKANHGETRNEVLGGGDATKPFQSFTLRQPPLTYVASPTPAGAESTLKVFVNDVQWRETDTLAGLAPADRKFITRTDDEGKTTVVFGNGEHGARLPTGAENIRAIYRNGIGKAGNVRAGQISLLLTRPLGVKEVINPLRASGGADKEGRDLARKNAPLTVTALDRLVSTEDYADFARTFAGIGKSVAARFSDGRRELVHVTIAGADNIPIDESSDLFRHLTQALRRFGDPFQPFKVELRELKFLVISARVRILPDYLWDPVVANIRAKLLDTFSFERRELGQDALLSEVVSAIQSVRGVAYVDVDVFGGAPEKKVDGAQRRLLTPEEILEEVRKLTTPAPRVPVNLAGFEGGVIRPAQLAYLTPDVPETLILNQI
jgi:hypothetical protein